MWLAPLLSIEFFSSPLSLETALEVLVCGSWLGCFQLISDFKKHLCTYLIALRRHPQLSVTGCRYIFRGVGKEETKIFHIMTLSRNSKMF